jgi:predicted nucleotidyltransferase component of viral defense system
VSLFDQLVDEALRSRADLSSLRPVVEKELLHHDILREMSGAGLLAGLTFIGGTCLRACYGSSRLSED